MNALKNEYATLLASAARKLGGASQAAWLSLISSSTADASELAAMRPAAAELSKLSGYSESSLGSLFTGVQLCSDPLQIAHAAAFGPGLTAVELMSSGIDDSAALPGRLATRLSHENRRLFESAMLDFAQAQPGLASALVRVGSEVDAAGVEVPVTVAWPFAQTPTTVVLPRAFRHADAALQRVLDAVCSQIVSSTRAALRLRRLPGGDLYAQAERCLSVNFLARYFRQVVWRGLETMRLHAGQVGARTSAYVSNPGFYAWHQRQMQAQEWMRSTYVYDTTGKAQPRTLASVAQSNSARRSRLLTVLAGVEKLAVEDGLSAVLITQTLPPEYHPNPTFGANSWAGATHAPDAGAREQSKLFSSFLRDLANAGVKVCGLRVVEAHKDACPHMHTLLYYQKADESVILQRLCSTYDVPSVACRTLVTVAADASVSFNGVRYDTQLSHFDAELSTELSGSGSSKRIEFSRINRTVASAASYVSKYVCKAIDYDELSENPVATASTAAAAHAAGWGYRRYAFFGLRSSLSAWDSLRRVRAVPAGAGASAQAAFNFAREGDYASFLRLFGGLSTSTTGALKSVPVYVDRSNAFGEDVRDFVGVELIEDGAVVFRAIIKTPGRYKLLHFDELHVNAAEEVSSDPGDPV